MTDTTPDYTDWNGERKWYKRGDHYVGVAKRDREHTWWKTYEDLSKYSKNTTVYESVHHRDERDENVRVLPAEILFDENGVITHQVWCKDGQPYRVDLDENGELLPTVIYTNDKGEQRQEWYQNGVLHRDGLKPAVIIGNRKRMFYMYGVKMIVENDDKFKKVPKDIYLKFSKNERMCTYRYCNKYINENDCYTSIECFHLHHKECLEKCGCCYVCEDLDD
jgi:hypothetical protein